MTAEELRQFGAKLTPDEMGQLMGGYAAYRHGLAAGMVNYRIRRGDGTLLESIESEITPAVSQELTAAA